MLTKLASRHTDEIRRQAMALAIQLPDDVAEARAVLDQTRDLLERYLIPGPREI